MAILYELLAAGPERPVSAADEPERSPTPIGQPA
jgi:hypothetical protein